MSKYASPWGRDLLEALYAIDWEGPMDRTLGICGNVAAYLEDRKGYSWAPRNVAVELLVDLLQMHPDFSGDRAFPIPGCSADYRSLDPAEAYCTISLWGCHPYADARRAYLRDSIELLRNLIAEGE